MAEVYELIKTKGIEYLTDIQLLSVLIKEDAEESCLYLSDYLDKSSSYNTNEILSKVIDEKTAYTICASLELGRRFYSNRGQKVRSAQDAYPLIQHFADRKQESFIVISLNGAHEVLAIRVVSIGLVNRTIVHPREVFADPIQDRAVAVIIAHNHPSGQLEPSDEDRNITRKLSEAGSIIGISVLDHLILSPNGGYLSFVESGLSLEWRD